MNKRFDTLDTLRGFALINMLAFHASYDLVMIFGVEWPFFHTQGAFYWQQMICILFIFISGCVASFSSRLLKRGLIVFGAAMIMTLVTYFVMPSQVIWFGVLHLLGISMIIVYLLQPVLKKVPKMLGAVVAFLIFITTRYVDIGTLNFFGIRYGKLPEAWYQTDWLFFLGFPNASFFSADYFPILPWLFLFLTGYFVFGLLKDRENANYLYIRIPGLSFIGKHTFIVYLLHQPVIYGILLLIFR